MADYPVPGGTATFRTMTELTAGGQRAVARASRHLPAGLLTASTVTIDGQEVEDVRELDLLGLPVELDDDGFDAIWDFNATLILALLKSWTLPDPIPASRDDLDNLAGDVYTALNVAVAQLQKTQKPDAPDGFTVDAVEDRQSPTGA